MKPIGRAARKVERDLTRGRTRTSSGTDADNATGSAAGGAGPDDGPDRANDAPRAQAAGGRGESPARRSVAGDGDPGCPICLGRGWLRRDVPLDHADFGRALACSCQAARLAARRAALLRRSCDMAGLERMTFESFRTDAPGNNEPGRRSLEDALGAAREFAASPSGWLVLHGGYGCGKTHLAAAIVNALAEAGDTAVFLVVPDLLDYLRASYSADALEDFDTRFEALRDAAVLVLDDLGAQAPTPWAAEKLFQLLNARYNAGLATVITSNQDLDELDDRLRSRLGHYGVVRIVEIEAIDYRGGVSNRADDMSTLHLYGDMTFATWDPRSGELEPTMAENLARALVTAREFAESASGWLVMMGDHGCGKTHLAAAIAHRVEEAGPGRRVVFVTAADLLDHLRATFGPSARVRYDQRFDAAREADLLVLDDLTLESASPWAREKLFQLLGHRHVARAATVITTTVSLQEADPWLLSRMVDRRRCDVFEILAPPYGLRRSAPARQPRSRRPKR